LVINATARRVEGRLARIDHAADPDMNPGRRKDLEPLAVGSLEAYDDRIAGLISIPTDVLPAILSMLIAKHFKFIVLGGDKLRHRRARLDRFWLDMRLDDDDMPAADADA
jgi:hypothetical protein